MKRILVIEDDRSQRELFTTTLEHVGYEVAAAEDGQAGIRQYQETPCDVVVTDIFMPHEDGIETIFELKSLNPHVKIIAISGGGSWSQYGRPVGADEPLEAAIRFGADRALKKPVQLQKLLQMVADLLSAAEQRSASDSAPSLASVSSEKGRILLIEDDAPQRELFQTALEQSGYTVIAAADGQTGMRHFQETPCDLVITDIFMPHEDGIEAIFELKSLNPHVKIIAISGGGSWTRHGRTLGTQEPLDMAKHFGADRTLTKPVNIQELLTLIAELLARTQRRAQ
jgi:CheY-like chemotaxis protein